MNDLIIIDLETTGLNPERHEIIEIGAVKPHTGEVFEVKVHPMRIKDAEQKALEINGYKKEEWEEAFLLPNALKLLSIFVGNTRPYMMAYNVSFDRSFLEKAYKDCNLAYPFHYHHLDLLTLAWAKLPAGSSLSLKNAALSLGLTPEESIHRALGGARCANSLLASLTH